MKSKYLAKLVAVFAILGLIVAALAPLMIIFAPQ
jgi:hypothetical protein